MHIQPINIRKKHIFLLKIAFFAVFLYLFAFLALLFFWNWFKKETEPRTTDQFVVSSAAGHHHLVAVEEVYLRDNAFGNWLGVVNLQQVCISVRCLTRIVHQISQTSSHFNQSLNINTYLYMCMWASKVALTVTCVFLTEK
jgi:hypothetical protein